MFIAAKHDLAIKRGDFWELPLLLKVAGVPMDFTGCTFLAQCRKDTKLSSPVLIDFNPTTTETAGQIILSISQEVLDTLALPAGAGWDLQMTDADGHPETLVEGKVKVSGDYSRPTA